MKTSHAPLFKTPICALATGALLLAVAALPLHAGPARAADAESAALMEQIEELKAGQAAIRQELEAIKKLLQQGAVAANAEPEAPKSVNIDVADAPFLGAVDAAVTIVEFSDYQCPFCSRHVQNVAPALKANYLDSGKVKYVAREFPLESIHPAAMAASQAALCAGAQDRYWEMHDLIFANQQKMRPRDFAGYAEELDLDEDDFQDCVESKMFEQQVRDDLDLGRRLGVQGTPSFFVGLTDPENPDVVIASHFIRGAQPYRVFQQAIDALLEEAKES
ncbi:MAG TPA: DsbA family protein [Kiloniellaceae bacterium]|nr:DsbA family protein [Kiloniellaceae bacterium]